MSPHYVCALHVGAHKTGTSLIQKYLRDREGQRERHRLAFIPRSATNDLIGWGPPVVKNPDGLRSAVAAAADAGASSAVASVVVSHENALGRPFLPGKPGLYPNAQTCARGLSEATAGMRRTVVFYVRDQADFLESYYLQTIHQGASHTFHEWVAGIDLESLSWRRVLDQLVQHFDADEVVVRSFGQEIGQGQEAFLAGFLRIVNPGVEPVVDYPARRNPSISDRGLQIALRVNPLLQSGEERWAMRKFLQRHFNNTQFPRPVLFEEDRRQWLRARFAADNEALLAEYAGPARPHPEYVDLTGRSADSRADRAGMASLGRRKN